MKQKFLYKHAYLFMLYYYQGQALTWLTRILSAAKFCHCIIPIKSRKSLILGKKGQILMKLFFSELINSKLYMCDQFQFVKFESANASNKFDFSGNPCSLLKLCKRYQTFKNFKFDFLDLKWALMIRHALLQQCIVLPLSMQTQFKQIPFTLT